MENKARKRCSVPLATKEMQIKTKWRLYLILITMAIIKKTTTNIEEDVRKKRPHFIGGENLN
jgi:hypothetical protein